MHYFDIDRGGIALFFHHEEFIFASPYPAASKHVSFALGIRCVVAPQILQQRFFHVRNTPLHSRTSVICNTEFNFLSHYMRQPRVLRFVNQRDDSRFRLTFPVCTRIVSENESKWTRRAWMKATFLRAHQSVVRESCVNSHVVVICIATKRKHEYGCMGAAGVVVCTYI